MASPLVSSALWQDLAQAPDVLADVRAGLPGTSAAAEVLASAERVVVTGNGAAYYVAAQLWHAAIRFPATAHVELVPAGTIAAGQFRWQDGDVAFVVSSSGELRDLVGLLPDRLPSPRVVLTADPTSSLGSAADAVVVVPVREQRAVTHTQAYLANTLAMLLVWDEVCGGALRHELGPELDALVPRLRELLAGAPAWAAEAAAGIPDVSAGLVFGTGAGWTAALEWALLLKEIAGVPTEGLEVREGATTGSYALGPDHLAVALSTSDDPYAAETAQICTDRGAQLLWAPHESRADALLLALTTFPAGVALAGELGLRRGLDIDRPAWTAGYFATARTAAP